MVFSARLAAQYRAGGTSIQLSQFAEWSADRYPAQREFRL